MVAASKMRKAQQAAIDAPAVRRAALPDSAARRRRRPIDFRASAARSPRGTEARGHPRRRRQGALRRAQQQRLPDGDAVRSGHRRSSSPPAARRRSSSPRTRRQLVAEFAYGDTPRYAEARAIATLARDLFLKGEVDEVHIVATRFVNTLTQEPVRSSSCRSASITGIADCRRCRKTERVAPTRREFLFEPSPRR